MIETVNHLQRSYPIQRVASRAELSLEALRGSAYRTRHSMWALDQAVFEARIEALKVMVESGHQPVSEARVHMRIVVEQNAVSDEAGDVGILPDDMRHVVTYEYRMPKW